MQEPIFDTGRETLDAASGVAVWHGADGVQRLVDFARNE